MTEIGPVVIRCPECQDEIPVPIHASLGESDDDRQYLNLNPDMSDLWAHAWTHSVA